MKVSYSGGTPKSSISTRMFHSNQAFCVTLTYGDPPRETCGNSDPLKTTGSGGRRGRQRDGNSGRQQRGHVVRHLSQRAATGHPELAIQQWANGKPQISREMGQAKDPQFWVYQHSIWFI